MEFMGWDDLNWLEDVHMGYEDGLPAIFDRNVNGWVRIPKNLKLPDNQQDRDMLARELLIKFQMSPNHPMVDLNRAYRKVRKRALAPLACRPKAFHHRLCFFHRRLCIARAHGHRGFHVCNPAGGGDGKECCQR